MNMLIGHMDFRLFLCNLIIYERKMKLHNTVRLLVPGHFYFYAVSKVLLRANDISVLVL